MEWIFTDRNRVDTGHMPEGSSVDIEISHDENSFEVVIPVDHVDNDKYMVGGYIYVNGTEYGGRITSRETNTEDRVVKYTGPTWRGMLQQRIVIPPAGADYATYSGDLNAVIRQIIGAKYGDLFTVESKSSGHAVSNVTARYGTFHDVIVSMCEDVGYKLVIRCDAIGDRFFVHLEAVPVVDYSQDVEVSQDSNVAFILYDQEPAYEYMVAAGKGELRNRMIRIINKSGAVVSSIPDGIQNSVLFFDYPNAETEADLLKSAREKFSELITGSEQKVMVNSEDDVYQIGDIVGGRDYITGAHLAAPIVSKILKFDGELSIEYKVGE